MNALARHRYPWTPDEEQYLVAAKNVHVPHKRIARELCRSPRAVDQQVARMRELGLIAMHRREEIDLLDRLYAELAMPEWYPTERM